LEKIVLEQLVSFCDKKKKMVICDILLLLPLPSLGYKFGHLTEWNLKTNTVMQCTGASNKHLALDELDYALLKDSNSIFSN